MKRILILPLLLVFVNILSAQEYLEDIAKEVCECASKIDYSLTKKAVQLQIGLCVISSAKNYKKKIKKDLEIDMDNLAPGEGRKLGKLVSVKLSNYCPETFAKIYDKAAEEDDLPAVPLDVDAPDDAVFGVITKIEEGNFIVFSLKDDNGKVIKLYWLGFISSDMDLVTDYAKILNKTATVCYRRHDYFDPRIKEYRQHYVITKLMLN